MEKVGDASQGGDHSVQLRLGMVFFFFFLCIFCVLACFLPFKFLEEALFLLGKLRMMRRVGLLSNRAHVPLVLG